MLTYVWTVCAHHCVDSVCSLLMSTYARTIHVVTYIFDPMMQTALCLSFMLTIDVDHVVTYKCSPSCDIQVLTML